jgi:Flp pilus assembly pilin Flp
MMNILVKSLEWLRREDGATTIEYSLITACFAICIGSFLFVFGNHIGGVIDYLSNSLDGAESLTRSA